MTDGLVPVLQMDDLVALKAAGKHLEENGFRMEIGPFSDLPESELQDWMTPENGGFIFYLEESKYQDAMTMLGDFFGYTEDGD